MKDKKGQNTQRVPFVPGKRFKCLAIFGPCFSHPSHTISMPLRTQGARPFGCTMTVQNFMKIV